MGVKTLQEKGSAAAIPFFNRAIELDSNFAAAYEALGISYSNLREPGLATENLQKSFDLRDRVSEREKFRISGSYYLLATGELEKAIQVYELWAQTYPRNSEPFGNLGVAYTYLGQYEKAITASLEDLRLNPGSAAAYHQPGGSVSCGESDRRSGGRVSAGHSPQGQTTRSCTGIAMEWPSLQNDTAEMQRQVAAAAGKPGEDVLLSFESDTAAFYGLLHKDRGQHDSWHGKNNLDIVFREPRSQESLQAEHKHVNEARHNRRNRKGQVDERDQKTFSYELELCQHPRGRHSKHQVQRYSDAGGH